MQSQPNQASSVSYITALKAAQMTVLNTRSEFAGTPPRPATGKSPFKVTNDHVSELWLWLGIDHQPHE